MLGEDSDNENTSCHEEDSHDGSEQEEAKHDAFSDDAELSLNAMPGVQKPFTIRLMTWIGKHEVTLVVDNGSTHNFINSNIVSKVGLRGEDIDPFDVKVASGEKMKCEQVI